MTSPESIVTSLDWSKKLKEAGWNTRTFLSWYRSKITANRHYYITETYEITKHNEAEFIAAAPTAEEILRRLPGYSVTWGEPFVMPGEVEISCPINGEGKRHHISDTKLANAAAAMYCYLAEQDLLPKA